MVINAALRCRRTRIDSRPASADSDNHINTLRRIVAVANSNPVAKNRRIE